MNNCIRYTLFLICENFQIYGFNEIFNVTTRDLLWLITFKLGYLVR